MTKVLRGKDKRDGSDIELPYSPGGSFLVSTVPVSSSELLALDAGVGGSTGKLLIPGAAGKQIVTVSCVYAYFPGENFYTGDYLLKAGFGPEDAQFHTGSFRWNVSILGALNAGVGIGLNSDAGSAILANQGLGNGFYLDNWGDQLVDGDGTIIVTTVYYFVDASE